MIKSQKYPILIFFVLSLGWAIYSIARIANTSAPDFSILWTVAGNLSEVTNPYLDPTLYTADAYPPISHIFYLPLTYLSINSAQWVFLILSVLAILGSVYLSIRLVYRTVGFYDFLFLSGLCLVSFPTKFTLGMGQINGIALFLLLVSYYLSRKSNKLLSGIILGTAIILKPVFGFFTLFFLIRKNWRVLITSLLTILVGFVASIIGYGIRVWQYWWENITTIAVNSGGYGIYYNQGVAGFVSRLTESFTLQRISLGLVILLFLSVTYRYRKAEQSHLLFSLFIIILLLVDILSWQHHFVWLVFPFVALYQAAKRIGKLWFYVLLVCAYLLVSWNIKNPQQLNDLLQYLLLSNTFYGTVILFFLNLHVLRVGAQKN